MQNNQYPDFKAGFKYQNIGNIVGTLNYAKELKKKDGVTTYGIEFLLNAKGFGSINVRIPMMDRAQTSLDNYPIEDKPRVRAGLSRIEQFISDKGKTYTSATTFVELSDAVTATGDPMKDNIAGRLGGEVFNIQPIQGENGSPAVKFSVVSYPTQKDDENKRALQADGTPVDPQVCTFEAHNPEVVSQLQQTVRQGSNIEVGYKYFNKSNVKYDDYGFPINDPNDVIERLEAGKIVVHGAPQQQQGAFGGGQQGGFGGQQQQQQGFGGQGQQGFGNQQQGGFGGQQQQQGNPQGQQQGFGQGAGGPFNQNNFQGQQQQQQQQNQQQGFGDPNQQFNLPENQIPFSNEYNQQHQGNDPFAGQGTTFNQGSQAYEDAQKAFGNNQQQGGFGFGN